MKDKINVCLCVGKTSLIQMSKFLHLFLSEFLGEVLGRRIEYQSNLNGRYINCYKHFFSFPLAT